MVNYHTVVMATRLLFSSGVGYFIVSLLKEGIANQRPDIVDKYNRVHDVDGHFFHTYDFIIIGGGSAGCVMASRLTEIYDWSVLLLEAGADETLLSEVPQLFPSLQLSEIDWQFKTQPSHSYCLAMRDNQCNWPRGKVLGGSSVLNAMLYVRGNRRDYDRWAEYGNTGWNYDNILYYFKKSEGTRIPHLMNSPYHGTYGPLTVEYFRALSPMVGVYREAAAELNILNPENDCNGKSQSGYMLSQATVRNGLRCSAAKAYLRPAARRPNLHVSLNSFVTKILFDPYLKKAIGVKFNRDKKSYIIYARREVILSAGTIKSPHILKLSGIGPAPELHHYGINLIHHAPGVGENLQDHVSAGGGTYLIRNPIRINDTLSFIIPKAINMDTVKKFVYEQQGSLYAMPACEGMAFLSTKFQDPKDDWPDIQMFLVSYSDNSDGGMYWMKGSGITYDFYTHVFEPILFKDAYMILPLLMRPRSRGRILLASKDPDHYPKIYANYFSDPYDIAVMVEGQKLSHSFSETPIMQALNATLNPHVIKVCSHHKYLDDRFWECLARQYSQTIYHPVGTCKMGPRKDPMAVVDPRLRVYGVSGLRVIDASVMPFITTGNTNAPTIMIAERAADMIKEEYLHYGHIGMANPFADDDAGGKASN